MHGDGPFEVHHSHDSHDSHDPHDVKESVTDAYGSPVVPHSATDPGSVIPPHSTFDPRTPRTKGAAMTATAPPPAGEAGGGGRVELSPDSVPSGPYANQDLLPVPLAQRKWTTYNFTALWVGMAHNVASWTLASGLVALGMDW